MTLTIELPAETERLLADRAKAAGKTVEEFAVNELERAAKRPTWGEIAAPFAADFAASGMTEDELDALVEEAREEMYFEQHGRRSKQP
jgi:hypothetical protein